MANSNIWDAYLAKHTVQQRSIVSAVLKHAMLCAPNAEPALPYGVPGLKLNKKPLIAVAAHKNHYGVYPFSPTVIEATKPLLDKRKLETAKGTIRFPYEQKPSEELIRELIALRTQEIHT